MFLIARREIQSVEPFDYLPSDATLALGVAVKIASGKLALCGATDMPTHIIQGPKNEAGLYPCIRVLPTTIFETTSTSAVAATAVGTAVQMNTAADSLSGTAGGAFIVTETDGQVNGTVRGYFKEPATGGAAG